MKYLENQEIQISDNHLGNENRIEFFNIFLSIKHYTQSVLDVINVKALDFCDSYIYLM